MANPNNNTNNVVARVYDEVVDKNIERLFELLQKIIDAFKNMGIGGGVTKQLEKLTQEIKEQEENGKIQNEVIDDLVMLTHEIDGKLDTLTPETMKEVMDFVDEKTQEIIEKYENKIIDEKQIEPDFFTAFKKITGRTEMENEKFKEYFNNNTYLYTKDGKINDKIVVSFDGGQYDVSLKIEPNNKMILNIEKSNADLSEYKKVEIDETLSEFSISAQLIIGLSNKQGFCTDTQAKAKIAKEINKAFSSSVEKSIANFVTQRNEKVVTSENGKFESTYDKETHTLRIRDRSTSEVLIIAPQKSGKIVLKSVSDVQDINKIPLNQSERVGSIGYDNNSNKSKFAVTFPTQKVANLFNSKECIEFLSFNGIKKEEIETLLNSCDKDNKGAYPVSEQGMNNVNKLKAEIENILKNNEEKYKSYQVSIVQGKNNKNPLKKESKKGNSAVYLRITDCKKDVISFAFRKDGMPSNICYKKKNDKEFKQVYNFNTKILNEVKELQNNNEFALAFKLCKDATNNFAKKISEPTLAQGILITEPVMPNVTNIRNVPKELQVFSEPTKAMSIVPNKNAVYAPFTKENVFGENNSIIKNECFYAVMLDSINLQSLAQEVWKSAMEKAIKTSNKNAIDTKSPTAILAYKSSVYEALSDTKTTKQLINYTNSEEFGNKIKSSDVTIAMKKMYPFSLTKENSQIMETIKQSIEIAKEKITKEMNDFEPLEKGEGITLALVSPESFDDNENRAGIYLKGDVTKRLLNFNEISDMIFDLVDSVNVPQINKDDEVEINTLKTKVIIDELKNAMKEEGISVDAKGKITIDNTDTSFDAPKTMNLIASLNNVIKSSFNGVGKEYLDKLLYNQKEISATEQNFEPQPLPPSQNAPVEQPSMPFFPNDIPPEPAQSYPSNEQTPIMMPPFPTDADAPPEFVQDYPSYDEPEPPPAENEKSAEYYENLAQAYHNSNEMSAEDYAEFDETFEDLSI